MFAGLTLVPALAFTAAPARAADQPYELQQMAVSYHDLDLATAKGRARLEKRLNRAAATVCGTDYTNRWTTDGAAARACASSALAHAHTALADLLVPLQKPREVVTR